MAKLNKQYEGLQLQAVVLVKASIDIEDPAAREALRAHGIDPDNLHEVRQLGDDINQLVNAAVQTALEHLLSTDIANQTTLSMANGSVVVPAGTQVQPEA